jgi:hypothetical protein
MSPEPAREEQHEPEPESPSAEPHAQSRDHKEKPTATYMVFVGTHFSSCYKCSWEIGPDNWIPVRQRLCAEEKVEAKDLFFSIVGHVT